MMGILTGILMPLKAAVSVLSGMWRGLGPTGRRVIMIVLLIAAAIGGILYHRAQLRKERARAAVAELELAGQKTLRNGVEAALASQTVLADQYKTLFEAADELNGDLEAAIAIMVPAETETVEHDDLPTTVDTATGSRIAQFRDSTFAGVIDGMVTAPPFPAPLGIRLTITRPAFNPTIGFVRVADRMVAVVDWQGEQFKIETPFFKEPPPPRKRLEWFVEAGYLIGTNAAPIAGAGGSLGLFWKTRLETSIRTTLAQESSSALFIGLRKTF